MDGDRSPGCLPTAATAPMLEALPQQGFHTQPYRENLCSTRDHSEAKHYTLNNFHENSSLNKLLYNQTRSTRQSAAAVMCHLHHPDGASKVPMSGGSRLLGTFHPGLCGLHGGHWAGSSLSIPAFGSEELGGSAKPRVRQEHELQAGLSPRQPPVTKNRHTAASTAQPRSGQPRSRTQITAWGETGMRCIFPGITGIGYSNHRSQGGCLTGRMRGAWREKAVNKQ